MDSFRAARIFLGHRVFSSLSLLGSKVSYILIRVDGDLPKNCPSCARNTTKIQHSSTPSSGTVARSLLLPDQTSLDDICDSQSLQHDITKYMCTTQIRYHPAISGWHGPSLSELSDLLSSVGSNSPSSDVLITCETTYPSKQEVYGEVSALVPIRRILAVPYVKCMGSDRFLSRAHSIIPC